MLFAEAGGPRSVEILRLGLLRALHPVAVVPTAPTRAGGGSTMVLVRVRLQEGGPAFERREEVADGEWEAFLCGLARGVGAALRGAGGGFAVQIVPGPGTGLVASGVFEGVGFRFAVAAGCAGAGPDRAG